MFTLRIESDQTITIGRLIAGGRGPNARILGCEAPAVDFPPVDNLTIKPGEECLYFKSRQLNQPGEYFIEPVLMSTDGKWGGIKPFTRISFIVADTISILNQTPNIAPTQQNSQLTPTAQP